VAITQSFELACVIAAQSSRLIKTPNWISGGRREVVFLFALKDQLVLLVSYPFEARELEMIIAATSISSRTITSCAIKPRIKGREFGNQTSMLIPLCANTREIPDTAM
jgi:hypothetical protein